MHCQESNCQVWGLEPRVIQQRPGRYEPLGFWSGLAESNCRAEIQLVILRPRTGGRV